MADKFALIKNSVFIKYKEGENNEACIRIISATPLLMAYNINIY